MMTTMMSSTSSAALLLFALICCASVCLSQRLTVGINLSGLEEGGVKPGVPNKDYAVPTADEYSYLSSRGMKLVRLPFLWERMQPTKNGPLDSAYLALVKTQVAHAHNNTMSVLLDCHNYARAYGAVLNGSTGNLTSADFANLWTRVAAEFVGTAGVGGYDIMNEPHDMPAQTAWVDAAQSAINAIRTVDKSTFIYVEGEHWSGAQNWETNNPLLHTLRDTECGGGAGCIVWSAHCYLDRDSSGTHFNWTAEVAAGVSVNTGVERLRDFAAWLNKYKYPRAHVGEMGTGRDNIGWLTSLDNAMTFMSTNGWQFTYWAAGPWFANSYGYDVDARVVVVAGEKVDQDSIQMAVLTKHSGAPAPTAYFLAGPTRGPTSALSAPFTLTYRGYITSNISFTCYTQSGGTKSVAFVTSCPVGFNCDGQFSVNVSVSGLNTVYCENDSGLQDAPPLPYNTSSDLFLGAAALASNVFSLRHIYASYNGPAITLRRDIDNTTMDFGFTSDGELDTDAIQKWCAAGCNAFVDTWWDQSPNKFHAGKVVSDFSGPGNHNVSIADQPQLIISTQPSSPRARIHFNGLRRMDAKSPIAGLSGQTLLTVMSTAVSDSDRLLSWSFVQNVVFPFDGGYLTSDAPDALSLNVSRSAGWHRYAGRWQGATANGKSTYRDNVLISNADTSAGTLNFQYRDVVNIGWFRWSSPVFNGDVAEIIIFGGALSDGDLQRFDESDTKWLYNRHSDHSPPHSVSQM